jgi:hypothetical protein
LLLLLFQQETMAHTLEKKFDEPSLQSVIEYRVNDEEVDEDSENAADVIVVFELNSKEPMVAFVARSYGFPECTFLPAAKTMLKTKDLKPDRSFEGSKSGYVSHEWAKELLSHCRNLLQWELGVSLTELKVQVSFIYRTDASERDKLMLLQAAKDTGYQVPLVRIISVTDVMTVAVFTNGGGLGYHVDTDQIAGTERLMLGNTILTICFNGDIVEIQSYSLSLAATKEKSMDRRLRLEDLVSGDSVDCQKLAEDRFKQWLQEAFGNSFQELASTNDIGPTGKLMTAFSEARRNYVPKKSAYYDFPLKFPRSLHGVPYNPLTQTCQVSDAKMREFCEPVIDSVLHKIEDHYSRIKSKKNTIDKILFAGPAGISKYLEGHVKEWGLGTAILSSRRSNLIVGYMTEDLK